MEAIEILKRHRLSLESLTEAAFQLYVGDAKGSALQKFKRDFQNLLKKHIEDPNVWLLLEAASHLDAVVKSEQKGIFTKDDDPASLVADELIGMSIAEYIAGKKGLFNYVRYDKAKPGVIAKLPPFMDDAVGALVASTMTRLFEE
jgi:alpha-ribazole phosphatase CobZ